MAVQGIQHYTSDLYELPSFFLVLNVDESESALIVFQDRLNDAVHTHLDEFFRDKVKVTSLPDGYVKDIGVSSSYVWKELSHTNHDDTPNKYEVRSSFDCQIEIGYKKEENIANADIRLSQATMDLLLIEAFQGDNYWNLVHTFLEDDVLADITGVKITVHADSYVHSNGDDPRDRSTSSDVWTPAMTFGVVLAALVLLSLIIMWSYLCCCARESIWILRLTRLRRQKQGMSKEDAVTDDMYSTSSLNPEDEEEDGRWMDAWAKAVTSIPLREPVKTRKLKKQAAAIRHPAQHHNSCLNAIEEVDDESSTVCSVDTSRSKQNGTASQHSRTAFVVQQSAIMEEEEEEEPEDVNDDESVTSSTSTTCLAPIRTKPQDIGSSSTGLAEIV